MQANDDSTMAMNEGSDIDVDCVLGGLDELAIVENKRLHLLNTFYLSTKRSKIHHRFA